jgi:hypothetical protein
MSSISRQLVSANIKHVKSNSKNKMKNPIRYLVGHRRR